MTLTPVWCVGLPRTGTTSLIAALDILGYTAKHNPRFEELKTLNAAADNICAMHYRYLDERFSGSKFILNTRDLESWLESMRTIFSRGPIPHDPRDIDHPQHEWLIARRMAVCGTVRYDRRRLTEAYFRHQSDVLSWFQDRREQLLIMDVVRGDAWETLCGFLNLPVPDQPFPHLNHRTE